MAAPSEHIKSANRLALAALWVETYDATFVFPGDFALGTASKGQRIAEANRQLGVMEAERVKINELPEGLDKVKVLKELDVTKATLTDQIRYLEKGCNAAGKILIFNAVEREESRKAGTGEYTSCPAD